MTAKIFLVAVLFVAVECSYHPAFRESFEAHPEKCTTLADNEYNEHVEKATCGAPKDMLVKLPPPSKIERVTPSAVWLKRCVGICDYHSTVSTDCEPMGSTKPVSISVRIYNAQTKQDQCFTYEQEEHVSCHCSDPKGNESTQPNVTVTTQPIQVKSVYCSTEHDINFHEYLENAKCAPKPMLVKLYPPTTYEQVNPSSIWINRCDGVCDYESSNPLSGCTVWLYLYKTVYARIFDIKTWKERCVSYQIPEHTNCGCSSRRMSVGEPRMDIAIPPEPEYEEF